MAFIKKVLVLKQIESGFSTGNRSVGGICRIEKENGVSELHLTVVNCAVTDGEFRLVVIDCEKTAHCFCLGKTANSFHQTFSRRPSLEKGFAAGLLLIKNQVPVTVAFAVDDDFNFSLSEFRKTAAELCIEERRIKLKNQAETSCCEQKSLSSATQKNQSNQADEQIKAQPSTVGFNKGEQLDSAYDDEAVATENYFDFDQDLTQKLKAIKESDYGTLRLEDDSPFNPDKNQAQESTKNDSGFENETDCCCGKDDETKNHYYQSVKNELNYLFENYPAENDLQKIFADGKFARINYSEEKFYVAGIVREDGIEKYICYGVPGEYSPTPPETLKGYATFIPLSIFDLTGKGFWMIFQNAATGECLKPTVCV